MNNPKLQLNSSISIIRVLSMFSIIIGHIFSYYGHHMDIMNIGVYVFLFISGFLYANKSIENKTDWIVKRVKRVLIPFWLEALVVLIYLFAIRDFLGAWKHLLLTGMNFQGLRRVIISLDLSSWTTENMLHCWFLTIIFLCYLLLAVIKDTRVDRFIDKHKTSSLFFSIVAEIILVLVFQVQICFIIQFFLGYYWAKKKPKQIDFWIMTSVLVFIFVIRIMCRRYIDGSGLYNNVIAPFSFVALGTWLYVIGDALLNLIKGVSEKIAISKVWKTLDILSFPLYLTHYLFLKEPFTLRTFNLPMIPELCLILVLTVISALVLEKVSSFLLKQINKINTKN